MLQFLLAVLVIVVVAAIGFGVALAARAKRDYAAQHTIVPGQRSAAPAGWAGSHSLEARLHRRLGDAVKALHTIGDDPDLSLVEARIVIEQEALAVDQRLIAAAALPQRLRGERIAAVEPAVAAIEDAVAAVSDALTGGASGLDDAVRSVQDRVASLEAARAELDAIETGSVSEELLRRIENADDTAERPDDGQPTAG